MLNMTRPVRCARRGSRSHHGDRGSVSLWVIIFTFSTIVLLTLVVDGGQLMNAKERAADVAEQAARAAANDIDIGALRSPGGNVVIAAGACASPGPAANLVATYAAGVGVSATIPAGGCAVCPADGGAMCANPPAVPNGGVATQWVTVKVVVTTSPVIPIGIFGSYQVPATGTAVLECGVNVGGPC
jgi:hypothetical protein